MKKEVILASFIICLILIVSFVSAIECQYKQNVSTGVFVNVLYDYSGNRYTNIVNISNFKSTIGQYCVCTHSFDIKNNIGKTISIKVKYQGLSVSRYYEKDYNISGLTTQAFIDSFSTTICQSEPCGINPNSVSIQYFSNSELTSSIEEIKNQSCKQCLSNNCLNDGQSCSYDFECGSNICSQTGNTAGHCISERSDFEQRLSVLESWKESISSLVNSMLESLTGLLTKSNKLESRIISLENKSSSNFTHPYFKYLSSTDRKNIVCGYAEDNHLASINDLGWNCTLTYKLYKGGERAACKCKEII